MCKNMKKFLAVFLSVVIVLCSLPLTAFAATKKPSKPAKPTATSTSTSVTVKWKKTAYAKGYTLYRYNVSTKKTITVASTTKTSYTNSKLSSGKSYAYYIKAYNLTSKKKKVYSSASSKVYISTKPAKPTSFKVSSKTYNSIKVTWAKVSGATSYNVQCSLSNSFSSPKSYVVSSNYKTLSSLKSKTKYYIRVRAIRNYRDKNYYSSWSSAISTTTPSKPVVPTNPTTPTKPTTPTTPTTPVNPYPDDDTNVTVSTIDKSTKYQTIDGFGASGAWWAKKVGTWSEEEATDVIKLLYSKEEGIGLNIYRYNLGAGSSKNPWNTDFDNSTNVNSSGQGDASMDVGKSAESFVESYDENKQAFTYNWNNDLAAQNCLAIAQKCNPSLRVTLFANSPPVELTKSGRGAGNWTIRYNEQGEPWGEVTQNIEQKNFQPFADYLIACGNHFVDMGYRVTDISPVNEPQFNWCTDEYYLDSEGNKVPGWASQEGCHYDIVGTSSIKELYCYMIEAQQENESKNSKYDYKISMLESGAAEGKDSVFSSYLDSIWASSLCKGYFDSVTVHSYWSSADTKKACASYLANIKNSNTGKPISVKATEYCQMYEDKNTGIFDYIAGELEKCGSTNAEGINAGVAMAKIIYDDMTLLNATEWDWWTACSNGVYPDGLVYINNKDHSDIMTSKRLWCLGNYSKFIDEGAYRVKISETNSKINSSAYVNKDGSLVVVYVNDKQKDVTASVAVASSSSYEVYTTSASQSLQKTASGAGVSKVSVSVPSQTVVTLVVK